jgi:DNA polymerase III subunit epsilon
MHMADTDDLEALAERFEQTEDYRILRRVPSVAHYAEPPDGTELRRGLIVDVETTGLDPTRDKIIELAILPFDFSSAGGLYAVHEGYAALEDPGMPVPETVTRLTGITDEDVGGQTLDDDMVAALAAEAALVIAHNAAFDRRFVERRFPVFVDKPWGCSSEQVPWAEEGLRSRSLDYLLYRFGWFFDGHRAMNDCRATLHLLSLDLPMSGRPALAVLLQAARRRSWCLRAIESRIELKDRLKARGYRWSNGDDGKPRTWYREVDEADLAAEERFLVDEIYVGQPRYTKTRIDFRNRFSDRE